MVSEQFIQFLFDNRPLIFSFILVVSTLQALLEIFYGKGILSSLFELIYELYMNYKKPKYIRIKKNLYAYVIRKEV